jgi:TRAP transporter TAXI family solute receptor
MSSTEAKVVLGLQLGNFEGNAKRAEKALADVGRTGQASAGQIRNATRQLPAQFTDIATSLAGGQNPFLVLLQQGRGEIAFTLGDSLKAAWEGDTEAGFKTKLDKLRTIGAIYPNYIQIVATAESGIKTLADLKGKSLSVGAPKSGTELNSRAILAAAGMSYKDLGKVEYLPFAESVDLMKNRQLNATLQSAGLGVASLKDLSTSSEINVVAVPKETVDKIGSPFVSVIIPANT